jgi:hypothetical protein
MGANTPGNVTLEEDLLLFWRFSYAQGFFC